MHGYGSLFPEGGENISNGDLSEMQIKGNQRFIPTRRNTSNILFRCPKAGLRILAEPDEVLYVGIKFVKFTSNVSLFLRLISILNPQWKSANLE